MVDKRIKRARGRQRKQPAHLGSCNFQKHYIPWNKDLKYNKPDVFSSSTVARVAADSLPVSRTFDFSLTEKLRPKKEEKSAFTENVVVSLDKIQTLIEIVHAHAQHCSNEKAPALDSSQRKGLLVYFGLDCQKCHAMPRAMAMTNEIVSNSGTSGSKLNKQLTLACLKTKAGIADTRLIISSLDITPPSNSCLYKKFNATADKVAEVNKEAMEESQKLCRKDLMDHGQTAAVDVQTDTAFNNRLQAGYEAGTQAFSGVIDERTGLVLECAVANKLCRKPECQHIDCQKNHASDKSISSAERLLAERNIKEIEDKGHVTVKSLTSDASSQLEKLVRELNAKRKSSIKHYQCLIHKMRSFQKALKTLQFGQDPAEKGSLIGAFRRRIYWEIKWGTNKHFSIEKLYRSIANVIRCFQGQHVNCSRLSSVCRGNTKRAPRHLPGAHYVQLAPEDQLSILGVINKYFSPGKLERVDGSKNTNRCENVHSMVFTYAPKGTTYSRNFAGMCHSAMHSKKYGPGRSTLILAEKLNLTEERRTPFDTVLEKKDKKANYDARRQQTKLFKKTRYLNMRKKLNKK